ncbi:MAG: serine/threonine-protein kinase [Sandaracinaceae bacterium]
MFATGDVLGSYRVLAHLRSGGMADLYLARREGAAGFKRLVAIKVVHPRHAEDEHLVRMFLDEALLSARIDHPNVVHVEDLGQLDETYFLVMEYVHGCSLAQLMRVLGKMKRRLSPLVAVAIAARVAEGLHAAHETTDDGGELVSLVHRDVSPQNILLSHKGHVKLIDFGVAKARLRSEETNVAMLKGKVRYMPPEQATTGLVDRRSDVYSLGIMLWKMLTMRRLFAGKTEFEILLKVRDPKIEPPSRYVSEISKELDEVVLAALAPDADDRPKSAKVFRRMLARAVPRSMGLDSAHLAELMLSVVGDELEEVRHELPEEVSKLLQAEQLRVTLTELEERGREEDTTESAVDIMTVHSDLALFDIDELDDSAEDDAAGDGSHTRPGSPSAIQQRSSEMSAELEAAVAAAPTEDDADPTVVGDVPPGVLEAYRAQRLANASSHDTETDDLPTVPRRAPIAVPVPAALPAQVLAPTEHQRRSAITSRLLVAAAAIVVSMLVGGFVALIWLFGGTDEPAAGTPETATQAQE